MGSRDKARCAKRGPNYGEPILESGRLPSCAQQGWLFSNHFEMLQSPVWKSPILVTERFWGLQNRLRSICVKKEMWAQTTSATYGWHCGTFVIPVVCTATSHD